MRKNFGVKTLLSLIVISTIALFMNATDFVKAETSDKELLEVYDKMESVLHPSSGWLIDDFLRGLGWGLVKMLMWLNNMIENIVMKVITMNNFYSSPMMESLMDVLKPLVFGLFVVAVFVLGFQFMTNKIEKRGEVVLNVLLAVTLLVVIPVIMDKSNSLLGFGVGYVQQEKDTLAGSLIKSNVADIKYYAEKDFQTAGKGSNKYVGSDDIPPLPADKEKSSVGTTEYKFANQLSGITPDIYPIEKLDLNLAEKKGGYEGSDWEKSLKKNNKKALDVLGSKSYPTGEGDKKEVKELRDNVVPTTNIGQEAYYRYHISWGVLFFTLITTTVALVITVVKIGRLIFDLAFHQLYGMFVAVSDLTGGQRIKKVLTEIINTFAVIFVMVIILQMFIKYANWANGLKPDIGAIGVVLLLIAGAWAVLDAPDIVQRVMGIDAGLRSGYQTLMGAYAGVGLAKNAVQGGKKLAEGTARKASAGASFGRGVGRGLSGGSNNRGNNNPKMPSTEEMKRRGRNNEGKYSLDGKDFGNAKDNNSPSRNSHLQQDRENIIPESSQPIRSNDAKEVGTSSIPESPQSIQSSVSKEAGTSSIPERQESIQRNSQNQSKQSIPKGDNRNKSSNVGAMMQNEGMRKKRPNGWVSGSQTGLRFRDEAERAGNSGERVGSTIKNIGVSTTRAIGKTAMTGTRAVIHPIQTGKHVAKVTSMKTSQAARSTVATGKNVVVKSVRQSKDIYNKATTPLGKEIPKVKDIRKGNDIKKK